MRISPGEVATADPPAGGSARRSGGRSVGRWAGLSGGLSVAAGPATVGGILAQICYPLLAGDALGVATVTSVLLLAAAAVLHAAGTGLAQAGRLFVVAAGIGLLAEAVGTNTGFPFGGYDYATDGRLGPLLLGVPLLVPLAWTMLAYPALLLARTLTGSRPARAVLGAVTLTGWDLFLDPQMVAAGHWLWLAPSPGLPGGGPVPLTNYAGWLLTGLLITAALDRALTEPDPEAAAGRAFLIVPGAVLGWTWLGSTVGNLVFFDRPWVALYGFVGMGLTMVPFLLGLRRRGGTR